ncbi:transcriptional regulator, ArsR family [Nautilia profundicola AmH]|uniref:Transcriptional regulator, ArsR family n=1 Tax=Nautilia profundicola (strain ATCC BAA-1463 / DSM 18972 / AmH) TaxID=598659 RepID=B9L857_NAUPA|nr:metalloregulator ArsR/SmtB family transcription factor [Nautilia profundicola]ACM93512.1 transcriptional regulator, ArsR family [Nautilia profundicola AmH]
MEDFLKAVSALKDETRIKILKFLLKHNELCVCELEASFNMLQSRLSRHLKILKDAGFLNSKRDGKKVLYSIKPVTGFKKAALEEIENMKINLPNLKECSI